MPPRIEGYALLGDSQAGALVSKDGSIDWLCQPHFDSAVSLAALVGNAENGRWRIAPSGRVRRTRRRYRPDTLVLETDLDTADGSIRLVDFMPPGGEAPHVVRLVEGVRGQVRVHMDLRARFDYDGTDRGFVTSTERMWRLRARTASGFAQQSKHGPTTLRCKPTSSSRPASSFPSYSHGIRRTSPHRLRSIRYGSSPTRSPSGRSLALPPSNVGPR